MNDVDTIVRQLSEVTATSEDGDHLLLIEQVDILLTDGGVVSANTAAAYLNVAEWGGSHPCAGRQDCVLPSHVSDSVTVTPITEDEVDQLVIKASRPSLAQLYKNARGKGLVPASPQGYF